MPLNKINSVIVTGATGMIGSAVLRECVRRGIRAAAVVRKGSNRLGNIPESPLIRVIECDISDYGGLDTDERYDAFIHLAWDKTTGAQRNDAQAQCDNIQSTLAAVRAAARCGCGVFVGAGSQAEYGTKSVALRPDMPVSPESGYGIAKYAAGKLSRMAAQQLGMRHCWARILSVYGIHDHSASLVMHCISRMLSNEPVELTPCEQIWDYMYCDDAADALLSIAERGTDGAVYCLGSGEGRPLRDYVADLAAVTATRSELRFGAKEYYPQQAMYLCADISSLTADTGFEPRHTFTEGAGETVKWLTSSDS